eukprot:GILK01001267.1.p1 GENE.GILK01001267.1~~GILK01001267.1.p1  ORF type:complete len:635 (+),score=58.31 GILK01001267.1:58-1905(+)
MGIASALVVVLAVGVYVLFDPLEWYYRIDTTKTAIADTYDFIVVGAGSAGAVVAARLSENPVVSVLLLEAGPDDSGMSEVSIPAACADVQRTIRDWSFKTTPQTKNMKGMKGRQCAWPRGKMLGGSSSINYMLYVRGNKVDYDEWSALGNPGWGFKDVLPYFKRSEGNARPSVDLAFHGVDGPLTVSDIEEVHPLTNRFVKGAIAVGIPANDDCNGPSQMGAGVFQTTTRNGKRCSTSMAYIKPNLLRPNLHVATLAHVTKILVEGDRAVGVEFRKEVENSSPREYATAKRVLANKEVIISAGAVNSPQLLLLSGIGPREVLKEFGIPVVKEMEGVGRNLQDHIGVAVAFNVTTPGLGLTVRGAKTMFNILKYLLLKKGVLAQSGVDGYAFFNSGIRGENETTSEEVPDLQLHFVNGVFETAHNENFNIAEEFGQQSHWPVNMYNTTEGFSCIATLLRPRSVGHVSLESKDPFAAPHIDPNYLDHEDDVKRLVAGLQMCRKIALSAAFDDVRGVELTYPYCKPKSLFDSEGEESYFRCLVEHASSTIYHPVGTCKMGPESDGSAVVDAGLRVKGVKGLRVVDTSIMPNIVRGNTNAPAIMIGEKGADLIKQDHNL